MPVFLYQGQSRHGQRHYGEIIANDRREAARQLRNQEILATVIKEKPTSGFLSFKFGHTRLGQSQEFVVLTLQLATLVKAGVPIFEGLTTLAQHTPDSVLRQVFLDVAQRVKTGHSLGESLRVHPHLFNSWYVGMIEAGEASGSLDVTLQHVAESLEKQLMLKHKIRSALLYPLLVLVVALSVLTVLVLWVIPMFGPIFTDFGDALPWPTVFVLQASAFFKTHFLGLVGVIVILFLAARQFFRFPFVAAYRERLLHKVPLVGMLLVKTALVHFSRTLSYLLKSGMPILEGLVLAGRAAGSQRLEQALHDVWLRVREGQPLAEPLKLSGIFPPFVTEMIRVGESTGSLDSTLKKVADLYEQEVNRDVLTLTALIEPLIIVVLGLGIGFIVVAMYLPIFQMASVMS